MAAMTHAAEPIERDEITRAAVGLVVILLMTSGWLAWSLRPTNEQAPATAPLKFLTNLNHAPETELSLLPGIGTELARRIVADRETSGPFQSTADLARIRGIGPKTIQALEAMTTFTSDPPDPIDSVTKPAP